jgi:hypothetical protein
MKQVSRIKFMVFAIAVAAITIIAGCANAPLNTETSTSSIRAAEEAGAATVPQASLHLQLAKDQLELARGLREKGEKEKAASMLLRAEADAELSLMLARGDAEKSDARTAVERVRQLRQDNP